MYIVASGIISIYDVKKMQKSIFKNLDFTLQHIIFHGMEMTPWKRLSSKN